MSVRVIAGTLKSRRLKTPPGARTRPTSARVREAVFSILGSVDGARVLDLFAGSGALGIEALSRGAAHATFVERDRAALACIRENIAALALAPRTSVAQTRVVSARSLLDPNAPFDLVFSDPPWSNLASAIDEIGAIAPLLTPDCRVVFEHPRSHVLEIPGFEVADRRTWGDTGVTFLRIPGKEVPANRIDPSADGA